MRGNSLAGSYYSAYRLDVRRIRLGGLEMGIGDEKEEKYCERRGATARA